MFRKDIITEYGPYHAVEDGGLESLSSLTNGVWVGSMEENYNEKQDSCSRKIIM